MSYTITTIRTMMSAMSLSTSDLAYIAGFFDGEGSLTIHHNCGPSPRGKSPNHTLQVSIGNTDPRVLQWIYSEFGGSLCMRKQSTNLKWRRCTQWIIRAAKALPFLEAIRPFLKMKGEQVDVAIAYQKSKWMKGPRPVSQDDLDWREAQRVKIMELNARAWN